jgi:hypothetical protein
VKYKIISSKKGLSGSKKMFYFSQLGIYILKIHHSKKDLDYMILKGIGQTSIPNSKYMYNLYIFIVEKVITNLGDYLCGSSSYPKI